MGLVEEALDRSIVYATRVGDARERSEAFNTLLRATVVGPSPVDVGIRRCEAARGNVAEGISLTAVTDITMAVLEAMRMNIDIARDLYQGARQRLEEHGLGLKLAGLEIYAAMVELIAGDPSIVEPGLERAYAALERVGERGRLPTVLAFLARTRCALGAYDDALRFTHLSEKLNYRHDAASQILWAGTRGRGAGAGGRERGGRAAGSLQRHYRAGHGRRLPHGPGADRSRRRARRARQGRRGGGGARSGDRAARGQAERGLRPLRPRAQDRAGALDA
jgi:hypothetical protein